MAQRIGHGCAQPGCTAIVSGSAYCERHRPAQVDERESAAARGYDRRWRRLRRMYLAEHPLCEDPYNVHGDRVETATEVDHVVPLRRGGTNDFNNLQALCKSCHSRKTAQEQYNG